MNTPRALQDKHQSGMTYACSAQQQAGAGAALPNPVAAYYWEQLPYVKCPATCAGELAEKDACSMSCCHSCLACSLPRLQVLQVSLDAQQVDDEGGKGSLAVFAGEVCRSQSLQKATQRKGQ